MARTLVLIIATECNCSDLSSAFVRLALDDSEIPVVRKYALLAIRDICNDSTKLEVEPLANLPTDLETGALKGIALEIIWLLHESTPKLLSYITVPSDSAYTKYNTFLSETLPAIIRDDQIFIFLQWAIDQKGMIVNSIPLENMLIDVIAHQWQNILDDNENYNLFISLLIKLNEFNHLPYSSTYNGLKKTFY